MKIILSFYVESNLMLLGMIVFKIEKKIEVRG